MTSSSEPSLLDKPLQKIHGIGVQTSAQLLKMGILDVKGLLEHYPYRYEDYSRLKKISELRPHESVTIKAKVLSIQARRSFRNKRLSVTEAILTDETGNIPAVWFNQPYLANTLQKGSLYYFSGEIVLRGKLQFQSPKFESENGSLVHVGRLVPIYSLPDSIAAKRYRTVIYGLIESLPKDYEILPENVRNGLMGLADAWCQIHFPENTEKLKAAQKRLSFDELFLMQLQILRRREQYLRSDAPSIPFIQAKIKKFVDSLPFKLTLSQKQSAWEIIQDLTKQHPMNRLLQGDVGSGKTAVAAMAAYSTACAGYQTALLAPTEILAQQHLATFEKVLAPLGLKVFLLTASTKNKEEIYRAIESGEAQIVIGTHALLNNKVGFKKLGLVIIDEQHRFGVKQRASLRAHGKLTPHLLSMTATPIPRTLALTLYGDLAISSITEMPPGRKPPKTEIVPHGDRQKAYSIMRKEILAGRQCFVICPLLEDSDVLEVKSAVAEKDRLSEEVFPNFSIGLVHGQMKGAEKEEVMQKFKDGEYHILVSTSVVEVGIDVPNATVVLVEGAERFGLAQLHQFRGRVGRSDHPSYCLLLPTSDNIPPRLEALCKYNDGFKLSELDLKYRGMGELIGTNQSGFLDLKIADPTDLEMVKLAREAAEKIIVHGPELKKFPKLRELLDDSGVHPE